MLELLAPFESFFHQNLEPGILRQAVFHLFRIMHLYLYEYTDYLIFLVFAVPPFYIAPRRFRPAYLLVASIAIIAYLFGVYFAIGLSVFPLLIHLAVVRLRSRALSDEAFRKRAVWGLVLLIIAVYGLLLARETFEIAASIPGFDLKFTLPLLHWCGIAFMLPKLIHYVKDSLYGKIDKAPTLHVLLFLLFFPTLRLGPIERFQNFSRDLENSIAHGISGFDIIYGLYRIFLGCLKIAIYAAVLYPFNYQSMLSLEMLTWSTLYFLLITGVLEVYCHFGGYTDIAIGFSRLLGFRMMENFYLPFFSENIGEWWRRWHISLSFWLRDYVYRPLGGSRRNAAFNVLVTFLICGAWHYLAWNYIIWGLAQGIGLAGLQVWKRFWKVVEKGDSAGFLQTLQKTMQEHPRFSRLLAVVVTNHYFCITGVYFFYDFDSANLWMLLFFGLR